MPIRLLAVDSESTTIEGERAGSRTVILEFDSEDDFRRWYDSPDYQAIIGKRHASPSGFAILVKGL